MRSNVFFLCACHVGAELTTAFCLTAPDLFTHEHSRLITGPFESVMFGLGAVVKSSMATKRTDAEQQMFKLPDRSRVSSTCSFEPAV